MAQFEDVLTAVRNEQWDKVEAFLTVHWGTTCPLIFAPNLAEPWEVRVDDNAFNSELIRMLAAAYCLDENAGTDLSLLRSSCALSSGHARAVCGHVFRAGEATYSCKECACDPTCVLCYQCFQNSVHKRHKYRMSTSFGSGYCDCGDLEAWKEYASCSLHSPDPADGPLAATGTQPSEEGLAEVVERRVLALTKILLTFAVRIIGKKQETNETSVPFPFEEFPLGQSVPPYQTVLFNDETHTYDSVIRALHLAINCTGEQAMLLATIVDREGRSSVRAGGFDFCAKAQADIQHWTQKDVNRRTEKSGPLTVKVVDSRLVALQKFAVRIIGWLVSQTQVYPPLAFAVGQVLLHEECPGYLAVESTGASSGKQTILTCLMNADRFLWKAARSNIHQMLMATVLMDADQKLEFARQFMRCYKEMYFDFIDDDHEHTVSVVALTVQVFTVPTIARVLISKESAIELIFMAIKDHCVLYKYVKEAGYFDFATRPFPNVLRRALYMMHDVKYLLTVVPSDIEWTPELRSAFLKGCVAFLNFIACMQDMDEVVRQSVEHQLWELEWESAFNIQLRVQSVISLLIAWINSDKEVHASVFRTTLDMLQVVADTHCEIGRKIPVTVNGVSARCIPFDVSRCHLSIHNPIWRFLAGLFTAPSDFLDDICKSRNNFFGMRAMLCEMPLRVLVLCAQCQAHMWRRNGYSLVNQVQNYLSPLCRTEMFDRDILMLQVVAAITNPDVFLIRLLHRFGLSAWAELDFEEQRTASVPSSVATEELSKSLVTLAEELLHLLISIIGERYTPGVGKSTLEQMLRREVLHVLATGPKPFSMIDRAIPDTPLLERLSLDDAVKAVADFKKPTETSAGTFSLKKSLRGEFNPFFYHYSKSDVSQAEQYQRKERANVTDEAIAACAPPMPPPFEPFFANIRGLLTSPVMLRLLFSVFERTMKRSRYSSEGLFYRALFLVAMGLNEDTADEHFPFLAEAHSEDIFSLLNLINGKPEAESHSALLHYVLQRYKTLRAAQFNVQPDSDESKEPIVSEAEKRAKKAATAARMRKQALEQMNRMQKQFITQNKQLLEGESTAMEGESSGAVRIGDDEEPLGTLASDHKFPVCLGLDRSEVQKVPTRRVMCILCQEIEEVKFDSRPLVCVAFVQESSLFAQSDTGLRLRPSSLVLASNLRCGTHASTCGHVMHFHCYEHFMELQRFRDRGRGRQPMVLNQRMVSIEHGEYLCPLCKRLSNTAIPLLPALSSIELRKFSDEKNVRTMEFGDWVNMLSEVLNEDFLSLSERPVKSHNRKRSHSERSLLDLHKSLAENEDSLGSSVTSSSRLSLSVGSVDHAVDATMENVGGRSEGTASFPSPGVAGSRPRTPSEVRSHAADLGYLRKIQTLGLAPTVRTIVKDIVSFVKPQRQNVPSSMTSSWPMMRAFMKSSSFRFQRKGFTPTWFGGNMLETVATWQATAFSLRSIAAVLSHEKKPLFGAFNTRERECVYSMSRLCAVAAFNCRPQDLRLVLGYLLWPLLGKELNSELPAVALSSGGELTNILSVIMHEKDNALSRVSGESSVVSTSRHCQIQNAISYSAAVSEMKQFTNVLKVDMLSLAVELSVCIGWTWVDGRITINNGNRDVEMQTIPDGSLDEQFAIRLTLVAHLFQIFKTFVDDEEMLPTTPCASISFDVKLDALLKELFAVARPNDALTSVHKLQLTLITGVVNFLRPLALYFHAITLVPPPEALKDPSVHEFDPLCRYLGFSPNLYDFLAGPCVARLFAQWSALDLSVEVPRQPLKENVLIDLPADFSDLINRASEFKCPSIRMEERASVPALCLVCGAMLCSQSYCCQKTVEDEVVGACTYHLRNCSGPSGGMFLRIRDSQVVLLTTRSRGCFLPAPYVDEFGETDIGFKRGNPLYLNREMYAKLENLWMHQAITEEVVNQYEIDHRNIGFEWYHF